MNYYDKSYFLNHEVTKDTKGHKGRELETHEGVLRRKQIGPADFFVAVEVCDPAILTGQAARKA